MKTARHLTSFDNDQSVKKLVLLEVRSWFNSSAILLAISDISSSFACALKGVADRCITVIHDVWIIGHPVLSEDNGANIGNQGDRLREDRRILGGRLKKHDASIPSSEQFSYSS